MCSSTACTYYSGEDVVNQLAPPNNQVRRVAVLLGSLLGIELARAASVGASALILRDKMYKVQWMVMDTDIQMEKSITAL